MNRREFIKKAGLLGLGIVAAPMAMAKVLAESKPATAYELMAEMLEKSEPNIDFGNIDYETITFPMSAVALSRFSEGEEPILTRGFEKATSKARERWRENLKLLQAI